MDPTPAPEPHRLSRPPLVEAIFELHWKLADNKQGGAIDAGFKLLLGRYFDRVQSRFPTVSDLPQAAMPEEFTPHLVRHQFRASEGGWPLTQLGPGILTVNDTGAYSWDGFFPLVECCTSALFDAYPGASSALVPSRVSLKYLNAVRLDKLASQPMVFLEKYLHTHIAVDASPPMVEQTATGVALQLAYPLTSGAGVLQTTLSTGKLGEDPALVWENTVIVEGGRVPRDLKAILDWVNQANNVAAHWFTALARGPLYEQFRAD